MLPAKMFAVLAFLLAVYAVFVASRWQSHFFFDVPLPGMYFVVEAPHVQLFVALVCAVFAGFYAAVARWIPSPPNRTFWILHFVLAALAGALFAAFTIAGVHRNSDTAAFRHHPVIYIGFAAIFSFLLSCMLFVLNLGYVLLRWAWSR